MIVVLLVRLKTRTGTTETRFLIPRPQCRG